MNRTLNKEEEEEDEEKRVTEIYHELLASLPVQFSSLTALGSKGPT